MSTDAERGAGAGRSGAATHASVRARGFAIWTYRFFGLWLLIPFASTAWLYDEPLRLQLGLAIATVVEVSSLRPRVVARPGQLDVIGLVGRRRNPPTGSPASTSATAVCGGTGSSSCGCSS